MAKGLSETNDKLVRDFLLCWERRETEKVVAACADEAIWHFRPLEPIVGREAIRSFVERYADTPGGPYHILNQVAGERVVMNERNDHITLNGKAIVRPSCGVFEIDGGYIKAWRDYYDTSGLGA